MKKTAAALLVLLLVALGWAWAERRLPGQSATTLADDAPLRFVPADTPFVFATLAPLPPAVSAHWMAELDRMQPLWRAQFDQWRTAARSADAEPALVPVLDLLEREFSGKRALEVLDSLGLSRQPQVALYGVGLLPVLRMTLSDPARLNDFVARLEQASGSVLPSADIDGRHYWQLADPDGRAAVAITIVDDQLIATALPLPADPALLRRLFGFERPTRSMADSGGLHAMNAELGLLPYLSGHVDSRRLLAAVSGPQAPSEATLFTALGVEPPVLEGACATEWQALAEAWPRIAFGYRRFDERVAEVLTIVQMRPDLAAALQPLQVSMAGLSALESDALAHAGMALAIGELPNVVAALAERVEQSPWQCPSLAPMNKAFTDARRQVVNPALYAAAPVLSSVHVTLRELVFDDATQMPRLAGRIVVGSANPQALLGMARNFVPGLDAVPLAADGTPQPLPASAGFGIDQPVHVAMSATAIGLAVGVGEEATLGRALQPGDATGPLLAFGTGQGFYPLLGEQMLRWSELSAPASDPAATVDGAQAEALRQTWAALAQRSDSRLQLTARGIELLQRTELD